MASVRIGFIGAGRIADLHARAYRDNPDAELVAVADAEPGRAKAKAQQWGAAYAFEDYRDLLARADIDGVEILLPHDLHSAVGIEALAAGKAVSLQKPPGVSLQEADRLFETADQSSHLFRVFDNFLCYQPFRFAKRLIEEGEIGDPLLFRISAVYGRGIGGWEIPDDAKRWRADPARAGGPSSIVDHGAHMAATIVYMMGGVDSVHTFNETAGESSGVLANAPLTISFRMRDGARLGLWTMVRTTDIEIPTDYYPGDEMVEVVGSKGILWVNRCSGRLLDAPPVSLRQGIKTRHFDDMETDWGESFRVGGEEFARAIRDGSQPDMDVSFARHVFLFQQAALVSADQSRQVSLSEIG